MDNVASYCSCGFVARKGVFPKRWREYFFLIYRFIFSQNISKITTQLPMFTCILEAPVFRFPRKELFVVCCSRWPCACSLPATRLRGYSGYFGYKLVHLAETRITPHMQYGDMLCYAMFLSLFCFGFFNRRRALGRILSVWETADWLHGLENDKKKMSWTQRQWWVSGGWNISSWFLIDLMGFWWESHCPA